MPDWLNVQQIEELIESKRKWIYTNLAEWEDLNATRVNREFINGEGFLYLGRSYRLQLVDDQDVDIKLKDGYFCVRSGEDGIGSAEVFKEFYRQKGRERIPERVALYEAPLGVSADSIRVQELQNRWGSCTPQGGLCFHWKSMMAPLSVLDYIVVHELSHLKHPNHTAEFWNEIDKVMPDYHDKKEWLRVNGAGMDL